MKKIKIFCGWELEIDMEHEKQIELYVDRIPSDVVPEDTIRFVFLLEPPEIMDLSSHALRGIQLGTYNYLLTHNQSLIDATDRSHLFPFGTGWVRDYKFPDKKFEVSTLVGGKLMAPGHHLRHKVWFKENRITSPKKFFLSGNFGNIPNINNNPVLGNDKTPLFDSQFHICIENTKRQNWFTEKIIDCLQTKTVPIYWGCPNIGEWFNEEGFIIVNDFNDIVEACNSLTPESYDQKMKFVEENYELSKNFLNIGERLKETILNLI